MYELTREKYLSDNEQAALHATLDKFETREPRNVTLLRLALATGGRASELLAITCADLDYENRTVRLVGLKGSHTREIPLKPKLFHALKLLAEAEYLPKVETHAASEVPVFAIGYQRFYRIWLEYRPVKKKLHSLRHTFAINLYRKTKDLRLCQMALGHKCWTNTMIYASYQYKTEELRKIIA